MSDSVTGTRGASYEILADPEHSADLMAVFCKCNFDGFPSNITDIPGIVGNSRFVKYHGQPEAIFEGDAFLESNRRHRPSALFRAISPLLFGWPSVYIEDMEVVWVNGNLRFTRGDQFISTMKSDWEGSTTPVRLHYCSHDHI